jgi:uncharacterized protein YecT (DUF1311 family)
MKTILLAAILAAAFSLPALAQEEGSPDPIDAALTACLDSPDGQSTAGMIGCADAAYASWDQELNTAYSSLIENVDADSAAKLKASQRKWVAFRDAEYEFQEGTWTADYGTAMSVSLALARVDMIRARVLTLRSYMTG